MYICDYPPYNMIVIVFEIFWCYNFILCFMLFEIIIEFRKK